jgi:hypothetical protein
MSTITELKGAVNTKTLNLVLLAIATGGIYPILWLYRNTPVIESITKRKIAPDSFIIWIAVCFGLSGMLGGAEESGALVIAGLLSVGAGVLSIIWAFKARVALQEYALNEHKIDLRMNAAYTLLLFVYYVNYCINDLPEVKRKQEVLGGKAAAVNSQQA